MPDPYDDVFKGWLREARADATKVKPAQRPAQRTMKAQPVKSSLPAIQQPSTARKVAETVGSFLPGVGEGMALGETVNALKGGKLGAATLSAAGMLPIVGGMKKIGKAAKAVGETKGLPQIVDPSEWAQMSVVDDADDFVYHVTSRPNAEKILTEGFMPKKSLMGGHGAYKAHSAGNVFFTDRSGVPFWSERAEAHLFDQFDDPPDVAVLRLPKSDVADRLVDDPLGSADARARAYAMSLKPKPKKENP